ncbi:MAG: pantoate--beta-alanine ligase [Planctomycetaceae bacterium]
MSRAKSCSDVVVSTTVDDVRLQVDVARRSGHVIGLVPTMGALHAGHLSLMRRAREESGFVVVSVFVNPLQFGPHEDFEAYPRVWDTDLDVCRDLEVDLVFRPAVPDIYPSGSSTRVDVERMGTPLEGQHRPGHFQGVATVVTKLFNIVRPDVAFFGQKDYQQQLLIRTMCRDLNLPIDIRMCPTVREPDGLALSSRNVYLSPAERSRAVVLSQALTRACEQLRQGACVAQVREHLSTQLESTPGLDIDYAVIVDPLTLVEHDDPLEEYVILVAAHVGPTRLIDNMIAPVPVR